MGVEDANLVAVDVCCSMVHAIQDMLVAHTHGLGAAEGAGIDCREHSKEAAGV